MSSRAGRNISLWKEKSESRPLNENLLSAVDGFLSGVDAAEDVHRSHRGRRWLEANVNELL